MQFALLARFPDRGENPTTQKAADRTDQKPVRRELQTGRMVRAIDTCFCDKPRLSLPVAIDREREHKLGNIVYIDSQKGRAIRDRNKPVVRLPELSNQPIDDRGFVPPQQREIVDAEWRPPMVRLTEQPHRQFTKSNHGAEKRVGLRSIGSDRIEYAIGRCGNGASMPLAELVPWQEVFDQGQFSVLTLGVGVNSPMLLLATVIFQPRARPRSTHRWATWRSRSFRFSSERLRKPPARCPRRAALQSLFSKGR
ncbi:hypothetical protein FBZ91_12526 [Nitrospirillum viridazoti]|nr:hypothetical protein FBZ91_12526 [Nitrospirillum amazonense]